MDPDDISRHFPSDYPERLRAASEIGAIVRRIAAIDQLTDELTQIARPGGGAYCRPRSDVSLFPPVEGAA